MQSKKKCLIMTSLVFLIFLMFFVELYFDDIPHTSYVQRKIIDSNVNLYLKSKMWGVNGDHYWIALSLSNEKEINSQDFILYGNEDIYYDTFCDSVCHLFLYKYQTNNTYTDVDTTFYMEDVRVSLKDTDNIEKFKRFSIYDSN
ncbi:MAG: hypothetical protein MJZ34_14080 [Paludibacteraceae bacterium]|nr:hypothetical protein [Paludibacteraceae bacterium]